MEVEVVLVVSVIGSLISGFMVYDSRKDVRLARGEEDEALIHVAHMRLLGEAVRLLVQILFLGAAIVFQVDRFSSFRTYAVLMLIAVPSVLAFWSVYSFIDRQKWINMKPGNRQG